MFHPRRILNLKKQNRINLVLIVYSSDYQLPLIAINFINND